MVVNRGELVKKKKKNGGLSGSFAVFLSLSSPEVKLLALVVSGTG